MRHLPVLGILFGASGLLLQAQTGGPAPAGTVSYVEGAATLAGQPLTQQGAGTAVIAPGQQFATERGKVEVLLTPGVFLRLDEHSAARLVQFDPAHVEVALERGSAEIEVGQTRDHAALLIDQGSAQTHLQKVGVYEFGADPASVRVLDGKAGVLLGAGKTVEVKQGHLLDLASDMKTTKFNRDEFSDPLTDWGEMRSAYLNDERDARLDDFDAGQGSYGGGVGSVPLGYGLGFGGYDAFSGFGPSLYSPYGFGGLGFGPYSGIYGGYPLGFGYGPGFGFGPGFGYGAGFGYGSGFYGGGPGYYGGLAGYGGRRGFAPPIRRAPGTGFNNTGTGRPGVGPIHPGGGIHRAPAGSVRPAPTNGGFHPAPMGGGGMRGGAPTAAGGGGIRRR